MQHNTTTPPCVHSFDCVVKAKLCICLIQYLGKQQYSNSKTTEKLIERKEKMEKNDNETTTSPPAASHPDQDVVRPVETKKDNTKASDETIYSPEQPESIHKNDDDDEEEEEEVYELVQVLSAAQVRRPRAVRCHTPDCSIKAAVVYATVNAPEQELWYSCLDCQVSTTDLFFCVCAAKGASRGCPASYGIGPIICEKFRFSRTRLFLF